MTSLNNLKKVHFSKSLERKISRFTWRNNSKILEFPQYDTKVLFKYHSALRKHFPSISGDWGISICPHQEVSRISSVTLDVKKCTSMQFIYHQPVIHLTKIYFLVQSWTSRYICAFCWVFLEPLTGRYYVGLKKVNGNQCLS